MDSRHSDTSAPHIFHTKLGPSRRVALPAAACQEIGLRPGDPITVEVGRDGIRLLPVDMLIAQIQDAFSDCRIEGVNASDELIAERRAEVAHAEKKAHPKKNDDARRRI